MEHKKYIPERNQFFILSLWVVQEGYQMCGLKVDTRRSRHIPRSGYVSPSGANQRIGWNSEICPGVDVGLDS